MNPYLGLVATRGLLPQRVNSTNRQANSRSGHVMRSNVTAIQLGLVNWLVPNDTWIETGTGSSASVKASIEYPPGTKTQVLFSGSATGTIANGATLFSDALPISIPKHAKFWVIINWSSTTGVLYSPIDVSGGSTIGDQFEMAVSGLTDKTLSGSIPDSDNCYPPVAIIGMTTDPSVVIVGDSIAMGEGDTVGDSTGDFGLIARSVGPQCAYMNLAQYADSAQMFVSGSTRRQALLQYASHMICEYGFNDIFNAGRSVSAVAADLATIRGYMTALGSDKRAYQTTITPYTTTTDNWATLANQTPQTNNGNRVSLNAAIRALTYFYETADAIESARDSGKLKVTGSAFGYTTDGGHLNTAGYELVRTAGVLPITDFSSTGMPGPGCRRHKGGIQGATTPYDF